MMTTETAPPDPRGYVTSDNLVFIYPDDGGEPAPRGTKIILLTEGDVAIMGHWYEGAKAWCPLPKRNKDAERRIKERKS